MRHTFVGVVVIIDHKDVSFHPFKTSENLISNLKLTNQLTPFIKRFPYFV